MTHIFRVFVLMLLVAAGQAFGGVLTGELDKAAGTVDDEFVYTLIASGDADGTPAFPQIDGLKVAQAGTSSNFSIINGKMSRELQYRYSITPLREGVFTIPAITLKVDGQAMSTLPITFMVISAAAAVGGAGGGAVLFLERSLSKTTPYVGEQVISTLRIYHKRPILQADADAPETSGVRRIPVEGEKTYQKMIDGENYGVIEITEIFVAEQGGAITLSPFTLTVLMPDERVRRPRGFFDGFFDGGPRIKKSARSSEVTLNVRELPAQGQPAEFSGLVGAFSLNAGVSQSQLKTGETATLTIEVQGKGSAEGMKDPDLKFDPAIKIYADKPTAEQAVTRDGVQTKKIFKYALVPTAPGDYRLGDITLSIFNTEKGQYETLTAPLGTLAVVGAPTNNADTPGLSGERPKEPQMEVKVLGEDLIDLHRGDVLMTSHKLTAGDKGILFALLGLGFAGVAGGFGIGRYRRSAREIQRWRKASQASKAYFKHSEKARTALEQQNAVSGLQMIHEGFREYLGNKFDLKGRAMTTRDVEKKLAALGLDQGVVAGARQVLERFDMAEYGGVQPPRQEANDMIEKLNLVVKELEKR